jgi:hypothetical protein
MCWMSGGPAVRHPAPDHQSRFAKRGFTRGQRAGRGGALATPRHTLHVTTDLGLLLPIRRVNVSASVAVQPSGLLVVGQAHPAARDAKADRDALDDCVRGDLPAPGDDL